MTTAALEIRVKGVVQGIGFRPYVYRLAQQLHINGRAYNTTGDVTLHLEGDELDLSQFLESLKSEPPPRAVIESITAEKGKFEGLSGFSILESRLNKNEYQLISPDLAVCPDCLKEILDPSNRRYRYPFTNCTNCGPRFTIIEDIPYDRSRTTMRHFEMCQECRREYEDPANRRFHAQPNACPACGPQLQLTDHCGCVLNVPDVITRTVELIAEGRIVALKGLGGFLLACDAQNEQAVRTLRLRKQRPTRPLAVMMADLDTARRWCRISPAEAALLNSAAAPIVLLKKNSESALTPSIAPGLAYLGIMLPSTPLHHILLRECRRPLVMTSGNLSDEPIARDNAEALHRLSGIADYFVLHNRDIFARYDDSVTTVDNQAVRMVRRARGYAPSPVRLAFSAGPLLACGPQLNNTFCLTRDNYAFVSQHIGDMENQETLDHFESTLALYQKLFRIQPQALACDLHPDYLSTRWAENKAALENLPLYRVQHHHAHIAACLAENHLQGPVIGVALDGTGYGTDGCIWGSEFLITGYRDFQRRAHLEYLPLPGGELAVRKPLRIAAGYLYSLLGERVLTQDLFSDPTLSENELEVVKTQIDRRLNTFQTSSCGRLFDAVSALLGVCRLSAYEGQAAIELEAAAGECRSIIEYPFKLREEGEIRVVLLAEMLEALLQDLQRGVSRAEIAARFHNTLSGIIMKIVECLAEESGIRQVALSGGVFQNRRIYNSLLERLHKAGLHPVVHSFLPVNDGCVSLGQAAVACSRLEKG